MVKISVIIPVLNEEKTILGLLTSLRKQTLQPTEVILVDGGSTDNTLTLLEKDTSKKNFVNLKIISLPNSNRSQARNAGILAAQSEIIAVTDAGCYPQPDWLEKLVAPFENSKQTDVVAGFYDPAPQNAWEEIVANITCTRTWNFRAEHYLPSSRSLAFSKKIWQQVGGYPEELKTCEDLIFAEKLKKKSRGWIVEQQAQVVWPQPKTLLELQEKIFHYALGDLSAQYERHTQKIHSAMWRVLTLLFVAPIGITSTNQWIKLLSVGILGLYCFGSIIKHRRAIRSPFSPVYAVIAQFVTDISLVQAWLFYRLAQLSRSS